MSSATQSILRSPIALKRLAAGLDSQTRKGSGAPARSVEDYVSGVFQAIAVFRFLSFALGVGAGFFLDLDDQPPVELAAQLCLLGLYNVVRVTLRFRPESHSALVNWLILGSDVLLGVGLVLLTNGLDSAFLVYSLAPVIAASLLMDARSAMVVAVVAGLSVSGAHLFAGVGIGTYPWILDGNYLVFALLYLAVCLLIAYLPFVANLNWRARLRSESTAAERSRLRREVHDNVAQTLAFLSLKVKRAEERASSADGAITTRDVVEIRGTVERAYVAVRDYLDGSGDGDVADSLATGLGVAVDQWVADTGLPVEMDVASDDDNLSPRVRLQLVQIAREALANVAKHASPCRAWVELRNGSQESTLRIRDDGRGFSPAQSRGHGLDIMRERAETVGASLTVKSAPGEGTEVVVTYPHDISEAQP